MSGFPVEGAVRSRTIIFVDTTDTFDCLMQAVESEPEIGVDLEADSLHHYRDRVCLIQVSTSGNDWVIDPVLGDRLQSLWRVMENPDTIKIFHDADFDLRSLHRDFGVKPRNLFDTKISLELLGCTTISLAAVLNAHFQVELNKKFQKYRWSQRPLSHEAVMYAAADTRYLIALKNMLHARLEQANRLKWAEQEFAHLETVRWQPGKREMLSYWRFFDNKNANPQYRECLRLVWNLREKEAEKHDTPVFKIFPDSVLTSLTGVFSSHSTGDVTSYLSRIPGGIRQKIQRLIRQAQDTPNQRCPAYPADLFAPGPAYDSALYKKLCAQRDLAASREKIDPGIIAGNKTLKKMAQLPEEMMKNYRFIRKQTGLRSWQWSLLFPETRVCNR
jgi:ribonuclease D